MAEHVVARPGQLIEAPVGNVAVMEVHAVLNANVEVAAMGVGLAHATRFIENLTEKLAISGSACAGQRVPAALW